jgi:large subunit ribosomal protein L17
MRHGMKGRKLGRTTAHREALFRNQLQSLIENERIVTTLPKAKELRPLAEKVITRGKLDTVPARRWVLARMPNTEKRRTMVKKVFDDIAPRFSARPGGYLRIVKLGPRQGDGAEMAVLEFVEREGAAAPEPEEKKAKKPAKKDAKPAAAKSEKAPDKSKDKSKKETRRKDDASAKAKKPAKEAAKKTTRATKTQKGGGA